MSKKYTFLLSLFIVLATSSTFAQIQDPGFENWSSDTIEPLSGYDQSGLQSYQQLGFSNSRKDTAAFQGNYAIRLETHIVNNDTLFGYIANGDPDPNSLSGGIPYTQQPDSLVGYYKSWVPDGDTALVLAQFKLAGNLIGGVLHKITDTAATYTRFSVPINFGAPLNPDSMIFVAASSSALSGIGMQNGSVLVLDSVMLKGPGITQQINNSNFENYGLREINDLDHWYTANAATVPLDTFPAIRSTDAYHGNYALKLVNLQHDGQNLGIVSNALWQDTTNTGGAPFSDQSDTLNGYYKFSSPGTDTARVEMMFYKLDTLKHVATTQLLPSASYTLFQIPFNLNFTPDTLVINIRSSVNDVAGSTLYIDSLNFNDICAPQLGAIDTLSGPQILCENPGQVTYSIAPVANASYYLWTYPSRLTGVTTDSSSSKTFNVGATGTGGIMNVTAYNSCGQVQSPNLNITIAANPAVNSTAPDSICSNTAAFTLAASSPSGGTYSGSGVVNDTVFDPSLVPGTDTISYSYTDQNGCTGTDTFQITVNSAPTVSLDMSSGFCMGSNTILLNHGMPAGGSYSGHGVTMDSLYDVNLVPSGIDTVTYAYTDTNGCTAMATDTVTIDTLPMIDLGADTTICANETLALSVPPGFSSIAWSNGDSTMSTMVSAMGSYGVQVTDSNGCSTTDSIVVSNDTVPAVDLGADQTVCSGTFVTLITSGIYTTVWSTGDTTDTMRIAAPFNISVEVIDSNMCSGYDSLNVAAHAVPSFELGQDTNICNGDTAYIPLTSNLFSYTYMGNPVDSVLGVYDSTTYVVTATDTNQCAQMDSMDVSFLPSPIPGLGNDTTVCDLDSLQIGTGILFNSYNWNTGDTVSNIYVSSTGEYTLEVTGQNGCRGSEDIEVTFSTPPDVNLGSDTTICVGDNIQLDAGTGNSYSWSTGESTRFITVSSAATYSVTVTNSDGCTGSGQLTILGTNSLPTPAISPQDTLICAGDIAVLDAGVYTGYQWNTGSSSQTINASTQGTYTVTVTDGNGCEGSASTSVYLTTNQDSCGNVGIGNTDLSKNPIRLYPNPTAGKINLELAGDMEINYELLSYNGKKIGSGNIAGRGVHEINALSDEELAPGIYILRVVQEENVQHIKVVKQ